MKSGEKQQQLAAALLQENPDLIERLDGSGSGDAAGLRPDELELIGVSMSSLSPTANAERVERMAKLVSAGLGVTEVETARAKRLARLLGQLDDEHLLVLMFHDRSASPERREQIAAKHPHLFFIPARRPSLLERLERGKSGFPPERPPPRPTKAEVRERDLQKLHVKLCSEHLLSLGLLRNEATEHGPDPRIYLISGPGHEFLAAIGLLALDRPDYKPSYW